MKPRCTGTKVNGHFTGFVCVLDDGHAGYCEPYRAPDVEEWRALKARAADYEARMVDWWERCKATETELAASLELEGIRRHRAESARDDCARLQSELDAMRAILESGAGSTKSASDLLANVLRGDYRWPDGAAWAIGEAHRLLTGGEPDGVYVRAIVESGKGSP